MHMLQDLRHPHPFLASGMGLDGDYPMRRRRVQSYRNQLVLEPLDYKDNPYPRITVSAYQSIHGTEDSILFGEIAILTQQCETAPTSQQSK